LSLAVGTAKSHPISELGRQETAVAFLTELEEKLEVAQAQLQILKTVRQEAESGDEFIKAKAQELNASLKTVTEVRSHVISHSSGLNTFSYLRTMPSH
jgi:nuclear pore complex protein Nup155